MPYSNFTSGTPFNIPVDVFAWPIFITARRDPTTNDIENPGTRWMNEITRNIFETSGSGVWLEGGVGPASTTEYGTVLLTDNSQPVATKAYVDAIAIAGAPVATTTVAGIGQLATDAEAIAGTPSTGLLALFVTPSNLAAVLAGGTNPGVFTDLTATGTVSFTGATGGITMTSATASSFGTTGAGIDLTLSSAAGRVVINGEEAAADAVRILSAAGGLDVDVALQMNLTSSQVAGDAIRINASAGGIDIDSGSATEDINIESAASLFLISNESAVDSIKLDAVAGGIKIFASAAAAGEDIEIAATGSSVIISSTENDAGAIYVHANGGTSERVRLHSDLGTGVDSVLLESDVGGITLLSGLASADAINLTSSAGGVDIDGALQVNIASSQNAASAIVITASAGGIDILAPAAGAGEDIDIVATGSSVNIQATESDVNAITINASGLAGGINVDSGTSGVIIDTTGAISLDAAAASNFTVTGAFDISMITTLGSANITAGEDAADAIVISAGAGGIDILATGAAGQDIDIVNTGGSVNITATEDDVGAIYIRANGGVSERVRIHSDLGTAVDSVRLESDVGGLTLLSGLASADAINLTSSAGGVDIDGALQVNIASSQVANNAISIQASAGGIDIDANGAGNDINIQATLGSIFLISTESAVDAIKLEATIGGIQIVAPGAGAGEDIVMTATGSSVVITATESVGDAIVINASGVASGIDITAGTGSINLASGLIVKVTTVLNASSPYTVLGTDYFISVDTSGGAVTVTLPAATAVAGRTFVIRDTGGNAAIANITIGGGGTNLVGGGSVAATKVISAAYAGATVYSNGVTWNYVYVA